MSGVISKAKSKNPYAEPETINSDGIYAVPEGFEQAQNMDELILATKHGLSQLTKMKQTQSFNSNSSWNSTAKHRQHHQSQN